MNALGLALPWPAEATTSPGSPSKYGPSRSAVVSTKGHAAAAEHSAANTNAAHRGGATNDDMGSGSNDTSRADYREIYLPEGALQAVDETVLFFSPLQQRSKQLSLSARLEPDMNEATRRMLAHDPNTVYPPDYFAPPAPPPRSPLHPPSLRPLLSLLLLRHNFFSLSVS